MAAVAVRCYGGIDAPPRARPARPHGRRARREPGASPRPAPRPRARAPTSCSRRSSRSPATRPRIWCCGPSFLPRAARARRARRRGSAPLLVGSRGSTATGRGTPRSARDGEVVARYDKRELPNYGVFDEKRTFAPGRRSLHSTPRRRARADDLRGHLAARTPRRGGRAGATVRAQHLGLALPPRQGRVARADAAHARPRRPLLRRVLQPRRRPGRAGLRRPQRGDRARRRACSRAPRPSPRSCWCATSTRRSRSPRACATRACGAAAGHRAHPPVTVELPPAGERPRRRAARSRRRRRAGRRAVGGAARSASRDYVRKNGFERVLIGLSGGIDSALVAALAADALGAEQVEAVSMPTRYNSDGDAQRRAARRRAARRRASASSPIEELAAGLRGARCPGRAASPPRTCRRASAACS